MNELNALICNNLYKNSFFLPARAHFNPLNNFLTLDFCLGFYRLSALRGDMVRNLIILFFFVTYPIQAQFLVEMIDISKKKRRAMLQFRF